jgi:hypothetical protein
MRTDIFVLCLSAGVSKEFLRMHARSYVNFSTRLDPDVAARLTRVRDMTGLSGRELLALLSTNWETRALSLMTDKERRLYEAGELNPVQCRTIRARVLAEEGVS